ncbi:FAD-dependent oxidoreductase [Guyparkeria halophila]|uniref:FAD-dependent oxidoreductase n=1 Tax=Guyparkeria halophila TaxID=47960 RepID=A0ABZ0YZL4_9GAMM|nr:FAD-dependent oxidoreductase [Guyparkeria halophila]WQH16774.1 FAD-dependent oxidoreductase [Guyparkeria halophila]
MSQTLLFTSPTDRPLEIAVIGSGIAGLGAAWLLGQQHRVTLFERNDYIGGHTHTHLVEDGRGGGVAVDSGFIVCNRPNYPHLFGLLESLDIATQPTDMSFGMSMDNGRLEYSGDNLNTLFAQRRNLLRPSFLRMVAEILRFNRLGKAALAGDSLGTLTLGQFLEQHRFSPRLAEDYLLPMAAAIWSCPTRQMRAFPARSFLQFFDNHGLMNVQDRPQWETVQGGSRRYVDRMLAERRFVALPAHPVNRVDRDENGVTLPEYDRRFDAVVMAGHADETLASLDRPDATEAGVLGSFRFQENRAFLHRDTNLMPRRRQVWSSWNYLGRRDADGERAVAVTYWMNHLQRLDAAHDWLVTLNPFEPPRESLVEREITYYHPVFDARAVAAQAELPALQGHRRTFYAGAWTGYGFHEDGLASAVAIARQLGATIPWESASPVDGSEAA